MYTGSSLASRWMCSNTRTWPLVALTCGRMASSRNVYRLKHRFEGNSLSRTIRFVLMCSRHLGAVVLPWPTSWQSHMRFRRPARSAPAEVGFVHIASYLDRLAK